MSQTRALRDKLEETQMELRRAREHLDKLRSHHGQEQEALRQELEEARREVDSLKGALEEVETTGAWEPWLDDSGSRVEPVLAERSGGATTAVVALARVPLELERVLPRLSSLLKLSAVDLRLRLAQMPPVVLTRLPLAEADALRVTLRAEGYDTVSAEVAPQAAGGLMTVRQFTFDRSGLNLEGTRGERQRVLYAQVRLLVRGRRTAPLVETWDGRTYAAERGRGRALEGSRDDRIEPFLWVYGESLRVAFTLETRFRGMEGLQAPTAAESLQKLMEGLRKLAPDPVVDERLMRSSRFSLPLVEEERSREVFADLLYAALQEGLWG